MSTNPETTPSPVRIEITPVIQRMVEVLLNDFGGENTPSSNVAPLMASAALAAALDVEEMAQWVAEADMSSEWDDVAEAYHVHEGHERIARNIRAHLLGES